jgi:hypothetical protein
MSGTLELHKDLHEYLKAVGTDVKRAAIGTGVFFVRDPDARALNLKKVLVKGLTFEGARLRAVHVATNYIGWRWH